MNEMIQETMNEETKVIEEVINDTELEVLDEDVEVIDLDNCEEPEDLDGAKKLLKKLGIVGAIAAVLVLVWKKFGKGVFMKLLASILRKAGWTVKEPTKTEDRTSAEENQIDTEELDDDESDACEEVEE